MFKSLEEIDKVYEDHINSLISWGGDADIDGVWNEWQAARKNFEEDRVTNFR